MDLRHFSLCNTVQLQVCEFVGPVVQFHKLDWSLLTLVGLVYLCSGCTGRSLLWFDWSLFIHVGLVCLYSGWNGLPLFWLDCSSPAPGGSSI